MSEVIKLFQYNTLGALMAGLYGGTMTIGELLTHGDLGVGTLDSVDGELIVLDGKAYQAKGDKTVTELAADVKVPYAAVVPHHAEVIFKQRFPVKDGELKERIESYFDGENLFRSVKITGGFSQMHVRMISRAKEGTKFVEVSQHQPEYTIDSVRGTVVGIWTPEMFHGVSLAGYHLHFVSEDFSFGGHVLDFILDEGEVEIGAIDQLDQAFPVQDRKYLFAQLNVDEIRRDIDLAE